jgi:hypothetical protein
MPVVYAPESKKDASIQEGVETMSVDSRIVLPVLHVPQPQPPPSPFPVGTTVRLKCCPDLTGTVMTVERGRIVVQWDDHVKTRHRPDRLMAAAAPPLTQDGAQST